VNGFRDGTLKGIKQVAIRGLNVSKIKAEEMRENLQSMHDFSMKK